MLVRIRSAAVVGIDAWPVDVETDISQGLPSWTVVGLPGSAVRECGDRIRAAFRNSGLDFPSRRVTVNLAPADLRKEGAFLDLPIALSLLCATGTIPSDRSGDFLVCGELSLDGLVRPVRGVLSQALLAKSAGMAGVVVPEENAAEARLVDGVRVHGVSTLREAAALFAGVERTEGSIAGPSPKKPGGAPSSGTLDLSDVSGQPVARRALEIAAAGHHALLLSGPPGCGKTMLAERLPGILPDMTNDESLETTKIYSASGEPPWPDPVTTRPFRSPHHTVTTAGLVGGAGGKGGGGGAPKPGEISFAHGGILFLDEFSEFRKDAREALRQPLESGEIRISRAGHRFRFPCRFLLVAATNPCPCGHRGHPRKICRCAPGDVARFERAFSGPLLDRIDLAVSLRPMSTEALGEDAPAGESSQAVHRRVVECRSIQTARYGRHHASTNGGIRLPLGDLVRELAPEARALLMSAAERLGLSGRGLSKACRVARTIADLSRERSIGRPHLAEALQYRLPDAAADGDSP